MLWQYILCIVEYDNGLSVGRLFPPGEPACCRAPPGSVFAGGAVAGRCVDAGGWRRLCLRDDPHHHPPAESTGRIMVERAGADAWASATLRLGGPLRAGRRATLSAPSAWRAAGVSAAFALVPGRPGQFPAAARAVPAACSHQQRRYLACR